MKPCQGHHEFSPNNDENKSIQPNQIVPFFLYYERTLGLSSRPMRDKDTSALREMFQYIDILVVIFYYSDMGEDCYIVICYKRNDRTTPPAIVGL